VPAHEKSWTRLFKLESEMTPKQKQKAVEKAVKKMREAAEAMDDLWRIALEHGVDAFREERFTSDLRERASYWENCTWWKR